MRKTPRTVAVPVALAAGVFLAGAHPGSQGQAHSGEGYQIDHVIVGVSDLDEGIAELGRLTGVQPIVGGEHPGRGTRNALLALGPRVYLELLAPQAGAELEEAAAPLRDLEKPTPLGWAVSTRDPAATARLLEAEGFRSSDPTPGSRRKPDGSELQWVTLALTEPAIDGAPFFIRWGEKSPQPATTSPQGCTLAGLRLVDPDATVLRRLVDVLGLGVEVASGPRFAARLVLDCPAGQVSLE